MKIPLLVALATAALLGAPPAVAQGVIAAQSDIRFVARQLGVEVQGKFRKWKGTVVFLPDALAKSRAEFDIDLASIDLASEESENEVKGPLWFDTGRFPVAHFASRSIRSLGGNRYEVAGPLSIKGLTRDIVVPITVANDARGNRVAEGSFALRRLDFKLGEGAWADPDTVANDVTVRIRMTLAPPV